MKDSQSTEQNAYFQVQTLEVNRAGDDSDGLSWKPYRDGQLFRQEAAAWKLAQRVMDRGCPESDIRVTRVTDV